MKDKLQGGVCAARNIEDVPKIGPTTFDDGSKECKCLNTEVVYFEKYIVNIIYGVINENPKIYSTAHVITSPVQPHEILCRTVDIGQHYVELTEMSNSGNESNDAMTNTPVQKGTVPADPENTNQQTFMIAEETESQKTTRKRPIPHLIPLNASTPNQNTKPSIEPALKRFKDMLMNGTSDADSNPKIDNLPADVSLIPIKSSTTVKEQAPKKKNESFFDKLKERLLAETGAEGSLVCKNCGFQSKCLSEHSVHEKNCTSHSCRITANTPMTSVSSTRCQNCRHRCKSSADLYVHMKTCGVNTKAELEQMPETKSQDSTETATQDRESEPHPMENVVFVWNNIGQDQDKYDTPLDISINDDSTLPVQNRPYDPNNVDALHDSESDNLSPTQIVGKKVFKCPHCPFWASTASRFHVHIVGHLNKKPFECSLCKYKSNWRWDITKHIKLKSARDPQHNDAKVIMTDETGRRNYSKYNKFLAILSLDEQGQSFHYLDQSAVSLDPSMDIDESPNENKVNDVANCYMSMQPLNLQMPQSTEDTASSENRGYGDSRKAKKTLWKCKKCNYKDSSKEALLEHVRKHSKQSDGMKKNELSKDPGDLCYRCGHCQQLSNWKHVIQRHCRLKHDGVIKVIATERPKQDSSMGLNETNDFCPKCPFKTNEKKQLLAHMQQHTPSPQSIFKCYFCQYFVKTESELLQHLILHGITDPEDYVAKAMGCKSPIPEPPTSSKRHKCTECPYETNSKSQYMYHEQFHRLPADTPYKCQECNYSVSKRHLLHQHMRVHGIVPQKKEQEQESLPVPAVKIEPKTEPTDVNDTPYVWVSAKNEFHKMYKCRYCSYVNSQKCKIPNHEKIHFILFENSDITVYKCLECKFTCNNAAKLTEHSKTHGEIYGRIYCSVELDVPDDIQIAKLRKLLEEEKKVIIEALNNKEDTSFKNNDEEKILYFCQKCPARFFVESELRIHDKFHETSFANKCKSCVFSVPIESQLAAHTYVHSDEYQDKTKMLKIIHDIHPEHKEPKLQLIHCFRTSDITWVVSSLDKTDDIEDNKGLINCKGVTNYACKQCPAKFFKGSALNYHLNLHGGNGAHKCKKCNYSANNIGNLAKHELLHETAEKNTCDYESSEDIDYKNIPLSGTDLFQRKTEAQKRVMTEKDKLVKPNDHFPPVLQADPQFGYLMHGNPAFIYPTYLKNGRQKEKRYKCHKCPSAFEKREQYKIHLSLHGSKQRYKCELCDYSVKYYANYVQHMRKHQMNAEAQAERKKGNDYFDSESHERVHEDNSDNIKLAIKTIPKGTPKSDFQQFSISDQQTLRLLQRRRSTSVPKETGHSESPIKDKQKDRKIHMCGFCPYTNQRRDALDNHFHRHKEFDSDATANHKCCHCDFSVVQSHFLREHLKTHFNIQKALQPQCFAKNEGVIITMMTMNEPDTSTEISILESENKNDPYYETSDKVFVNISTGDIVVT
ncbi:Zinc finger protein 91 [Eumeta japonica]|uniref:Zinc finger protein 91 n=1 Tax=Eumeta variegata TaxID=151549 RepID=A0A4C1VIE5_EUMVA|nr:Zinc finger protein 91 [Eumeta japonica]